MSLKDRMIEWLGGQARTAESGYYPEGTTTSPSAWLVNLVQYGPNQAPTAADIPINESIAEGIAAIYACVHIISETVGQLPLKLYRKENGGKKPDTDHPLYSVLHDLANPEMTAIEFREMQTRHLALYGRSYAQILRNPRGEVTALWPLHPSRMFVDRDPLNRKRFQYYMGRGEYATFIHDPARPPILHLRINSEDGLDGRSPLVINRESLAITKAADTYQAAWFGNGAIPGMVLTHPGKLSEKAKENLRRSWLDKFMGAKKANRVAILEEDIKVNVVGVDPQKSQLDELRKLQIEEAARIYRVPLFMIQSQTKDTSWGCLPAETPVFTPNGWTPIADMKTGDEVWSLGETGLVRSRVTGQKMTGVHPIRLIHTAGRTLKVTDNHRVFVRRYHGRGRRGSHSIPVGWANHWLRADRVEVGDYVAVPHELPAGTNDHAPNGQQLSVGLMELCGLYLGDGSTDGNRIELAHEMGADYIQHYVDVVRDNFHVEPYLDKRGTRTRFSSVEAIVLLAQGFTGTSHTKRIPAWVFELIPSLQLAFLRGFVDSDGCVQRGRIVYSSCHKALLEDVRHLCMRVGIPVGRVVLARAAGRAVIRGRDVEQTEKYHLALSSVFHNAKIGSCSPKKAANLLAGGSARALTYDKNWAGGLGASRSRHLTPGGEWAYQHLCLQRVRKIERGASGLHVPVYDLRVENTETFIADGVLVHNSGIEQQMLGFVNMTLMPWLVAWQQAVGRDLLSAKSFETHEALFVLNALVRGDIKTRYDAYAVGRQNGFLNGDDIAEIEDLNPLPNGAGKLYWMPSNYQPILGGGMPATIEPEPASDTKSPMSNEPKGVM